MRRLLTLTVSLMTLSARCTFGAEQGVGGSAFHKNDITYSTEVKTPHVKWARKLPGGPIKGFFIPSVQYGRDMVELMQRLDLDPTTVSIDRKWDTNCWGIGDYYGHEARGDRDDFQIVYSYAERDLTGPTSFEVMVIPGLNGWSRMTRSTRDAILKRVANGAGLVLIHPFVGDVKNHPFKGDGVEGDARIWEISPLVGCPDDWVDNRGYPEINQAAVSKGKWEIALQHFITSGQSLQLLPEGSMGGSFYKYTSNGDVLIKSGENPILAVKKYGKGRVAAFAYMEEGFIPQAIDPVSTSMYWNYWEYYYSLLSRAILWAAGRDSGLDIKSLTAQANAAEGVKITLSTATARNVEVEIAGRSEFGQSLGSYLTQKSLSGGENLITVPGDHLRPRFGWPGGRQIFDVIIRETDTGRTLNWGATFFEAPRKARLAQIQPASDVLRRGEVLTAVLSATGDISNLSMRFRITDDLERLLTSQTAPAATEKTFSHRLDDFLGKYAFITAELLDSHSTVVDQRRSNPLLVVQAKRRRKEYLPLVSFGGGRHFFTAARMNQVRAAGAETGFTWGGKVNNSLNIPHGAFGVYWYDRGPTTPEGLEKAIAEFHRTGDFNSLQYLTKKELYKRTGDTKFLARTPSFSDPDFMQKLRDIVTATARDKARYNMDYYFVGDEGSLTSYADPYDFDWSPHALVAFRQWLKQEYGSLGALNKEWKTNHQGWEEVLPFTTEQAMKSGNFAPWADHRTFMETSFANAYKTVRDAVLAGDPDGHIALSGTQVTTAYNGCDWYRLDQVIDDFISYDDGNQWDLHRSFAKPGAMIGFWTGYGSHGIAVQNAIWSAAIHNVFHPNIFWMPSYLNPDFTYSKSARDMGEAFKTLKSEGVGRLFMESHRLQDGIALHYSMPSVHAASITHNHPERGRPQVNRNFAANRDGWVRALNDLGLQFDFVSYDQVEQGQLTNGKYKVFILPFSMALSPREVEAITEFAQQGGIVIADAAAGMMDDHCAWQPDGLLNDFFGIKTVSSEKRKLTSTSTVTTNADEDVVGESRTAGITGPITVTSEGTSWGVRTEDLSGLEAVEAAIREGTAKALVKVGETEAVIVRPVGRGWAIYLNALLDHYSRLRKENYGGSSYRRLIDVLLAHLDLRPAVEVFSAGGQRLAQA
ncbi:MAG: hypothetical protein DMG06_07935, partial [Acidobacteria bacterium]